MASTEAFVKRTKILIILATIASFIPSAHTIAFDPKSIEKIKKYNECADCDLSWADLSGVDLSNSNFTGANLFSANLSGTDLSNSRLEGAILNATNLTGTKLGKAKLSRAIIIESNIKDAFLCDTELPSGNLYSDC